MASSVAIAAEAGMKQRPPTKTIRPKPKSKGTKMNPDDESVSTAAVVVVAAPDITTPPNTDTDTDTDTEVEEKEPVYCDPELFVKRQIRRTISIPFYKLGKSVVVAQLLRTELAKIVEGRCSIEGYICPNSVAISSYSCGTLAGSSIHFDIIADCLICFPDENTVIKCVAKTITQAGIRAGAKDLERGKVSPIEVFLSRDMHTSSRDLFSRIEENDILTVKIIGRRFVLHDTHVTIIAMLMSVAQTA